MSDDDSESVSREASPCSESPRPVSVGSESPNENVCSIANQMDVNTITNNNNSNPNCSKIARLNKMLHVFDDAQDDSKVVSYFCFVIYSINELSIRI